MKVCNRHERVISTTPERVAGLVSDFDAIWPTQIAPPPRPLGDGRYQEGPMVWEEVERAGAIRAFRVILPEELRGEHWFEAQPVDGGTLVRHSIVGEAVGEYEAIWRDRIEPSHDLILEAVLDNIEAAGERPDNVRRKALGDLSLRPSSTRWAQRRMLDRRRSR